MYAGVLAVGLAISILGVLQQAHEVRRGDVQKSAPWSLAPQASLVSIETPSTSPLSGPCVVQIAEAGITSRDQATVLGDPRLDAVCREVAAHADMHFDGAHEIMAAARPGLLESLRIVLRRSGYETVADGPDLDLIATTIDAALLHASSRGETDPVTAAEAMVARVLELAATAT